MIDTGANLSIATADGPGSGRFLARSLLDALLGDAWLSGVRLQLLAPAEGTWSVDFVFVQDTTGVGEVVRAGLDPAGQVVSAQLLRTVAESARRYRSTAELAAALRRGTAVESVTLETAPGSGEPRAVVLTFASFGSHKLKLTDFVAIPC
jgi:hypothetical protein